MFTFVTCRCMVPLVFSFSLLRVCLYVFAMPPLCEISEGDIRGSVFTVQSQSRRRRLSVPDEETRSCSKCKKTLPLTAFTKVNRRGLSSIKRLCADCRVSLQSAGFHDHTDIDIIQNRITLDHGVQGITRLLLQSIMLPPSKTSKPPKPLLDRNLLYYIEIQKWLSQHRHVDDFNVVIRLFHLFTAIRYPFLRPILHFILSLPHIPVSYSVLSMPLHELTAPVIDAGIAGRQSPKRDLLQPVETRQCRRCRRTLDLAAFTEPRRFGHHTVLQRCSDCRVGFHLYTRLTY
jgi:hypothetical protein